jgi:transcriptional regulator with XRE-family HTH domain
MVRGGDLPEYHQKRVGRRIVLLRIAKGGMKQNELAAHVGITPQKLANYESGRHKLPQPHAVAICTVTGANFDYIYRGQMGTLDDELRKALLRAEKDPPSRPTRRATARQK